MMRLFITAAILLFTVSFTFCQGVKVKSSKFYNITELGYGKGVAVLRFKSSDIDLKDAGYYIRLRTQFGYFFSSQFSLGLGFGLDGYHNETFNTAPLFADGRYYFSQSPKSFFIFSNIGYAVPLNKIFEQGFMGGIAIGKKIPRSKLIIAPSIGLNIQHFKDITYFTSTGIESSIGVMSVQFNVGLLF